jgi:hypothetical protein
MTEEFSFIQVHAHETFLAIGVPYPEFEGTDLFLYADDLPHGTAAVTAALAYKSHCEISLFCRLVSRNG